MLNRFAAAAIAILVMAGSAQAQNITPSHLAAARDLVQTLGAVSAVDAIIPQFAEQIRRRNVARPDITKDLNEVLESLKPEMELQKQQAINGAAQVFAKHLTEDDLKQLLVFFKGPLGQKYLKEQPQIASDLVNEVEAWTQQASEYVMVRVRAEMGKRGLSIQ